MEISTSFEAGRLTVYLGGELDHHEARPLMRQLDALLDGMSDKGIRIVTATAREITEVEKAED